MVPINVVKLYANSKLKYKLYQIIYLYHCNIIKYKYRFKISYYTIKYDT